MAMLTDIAGVGPARRPQGIVAQIGAAIRRHRDGSRERRRIERELGTYSDRELAELGITRTDIPAIARGEFRR